MTSIPAFFAVLVVVSLLAVWLRGVLPQKGFWAGWAALTLAGLGFLTWAYQRAELHDHTLGMELLSWGFMLMGVGAGAAIFSEPLSGSGSPARKVAGLAAVSVLGIATFFVGLVAGIFLSPGF